MTKLKSQSWRDLPRQSKLAAVMWPDLVPKDVQDQMRALSANERKLSPLEAKVKMDQALRAAGQVTGTPVKRR